MWDLMQNYFPYSIIAIIIIFVAFIDCISRIGAIREHRVLSLLALVIIVLVVLRLDEDDIDWIIGVIKDPTALSFPTLPASTPLNVEISSDSISVNLCHEKLGKGKTAWFQNDRNYGVYTGPGRNYLRATNSENKKASVGTSDWVGCYGYENGWYLIKYKTNAAAYRYGYIYRNEIEGDYQLNDSPIPNSKLCVVLIRDESITDDPDYKRFPLCKLSAGTKATLLCNYEETWSYIEVTNDMGQLLRGFIPQNALSII